jgi:DNA-binding transcriptional LysR family regulator
MSLLKMKILALIDKYKQVTAVANVLHMKQPTISFHMKKMEAEWGVKLFEARSGKIFLTSAGKIILPYASQISALYSEAESKIAVLRVNERTLLRVGCTDCAITAIARSNWLTNLGNQGEVQVSIQTANEESLYNQLQSSLLDLVICGNPPHNSFNFKFEKIVSSSLKLIVPVGHSLIQAGQLDPHSLYKYSFIEHTEESVNKVVALWKMQLDWKLNVGAKFDSVEMIISAVQAKLGLAILPECIFPDPAGRVVSIDLPGKFYSEWSWDLYASWRPNYWNTSLLQKLLSPDSL